MSHDNDPIDETRWTRDELAQLQSLSAERVPPAELKARTIQMLRDRALLGAGGQRGERRRFLITMRLGLALAAAASLVFVAGAVVGYLAGSRRAVAPVAESPAATRAVARAETMDAAARPTRQVVWF